MTDDELRARGWELSMGPHGHAYWVHEQHSYSQDYEMTAREVAACEGYADLRVAEALAAVDCDYCQDAANEMPSSENKDLANLGNILIADQEKGEVPCIGGFWVHELKAMNRSDLDATGLKPWQLQEVGIKPWEVMSEGGKPWESQ